MPPIKVGIIEVQDWLRDNETPRPNGSLSALYLAGAVRDTGHEVQYTDLLVGAPEDNLKDTFRREPELQPNGLKMIGMSWERTRQFLAQRQYDILAIVSLFTHRENIAKRVAQIAKEVNPETLVITGGVNARSRWQEYMKTGVFDLICTTEGERAIQEIVRRRGRLMRDYSGIPGTICYDGKRIHDPVPADIVWDLDQLPFPAWDLLPFDKYTALNAPHSLLLTGGGVAYAPCMFSRGCPFACLMCHIAKEKPRRGILSRGNPELLLAGDIGMYRVKSPARVKEELTRLGDLGVTEVYVEDDSMLAKKARVCEILDIMRDMGLVLKNVNGVNLAHLVRSRRLKPDEDYIKRIARAGFTQIMAPFESESPRIRHYYLSDKNPPLEVMLDLCKAMIDAGILLNGNFIMGWPDETEDEMEMTVEAARKFRAIGGRSCSFMAAMPYPGTPLHDQGLKNGHLPIPVDPDKYNWRGVLMNNTLVPPERVATLINKAWRETNTEEFIQMREQSFIGSAHRMAGPPAA